MGVVGEEESGTGSYPVPTPAPSLRPFPRGFLINFTYLSSGLPFDYLVAHVRIRRQSSSEQLHCRWIANPGLMSGHLDTKLWSVGLLDGYWVRRTSLWVHAPMGPTQSLMELNPLFCSRILLYNFSSDVRCCHGLMCSLLRCRLHSSNGTCLEASTRLLP